MSELATTSSPKPESDVGTSTAPLAANSAEAPVLITEQQVRFSTAAAVPLVPAETGRRWTDAVRAAVRAMFTTSTTEARPRRHYPPRNDFLESSRMAREMHRL